MTEIKEKLLELEKSEDYLFHGSGFKSELLEPKQAYNHPTKGPKGGLKDDKPAVFASSIVDVAIFMAILNEKNTPKGLRSGFSVSKENKILKVKFRATKETVDQLSNSIGYLYVLKKDDFKPRGPGGEWLSYKKVKPLEIIEVTEKELPENIEVKNF